MEVQVLYTPLLAQTTSSHHTAIMLSSFLRRPLLGSYRSGPLTVYGESEPKDPVSCHVAEYAYR